MSKNVTNDRELVTIPGLGFQLHQELLLNYFLVADIDMSLSTHISLLRQNNIRIFLIILPIILAVVFNSNSSEEFRPQRYSVLDNPTGFVLVSGWGYVLTGNGGSSVFMDSVMLIKPTVMSACSQAIPRISDSPTASDSEVASWSSMISTALLLIRQWIGFRNYDEPSSDSKVPLQQWVLLLNISQLERSHCKWQKLFESISTAGYSAIILPVRYQKTFKQIKSVWRRGLVKTQDLLIIDPSNGQELFKYTGTSDKWFTWSNAEKSIKIVLQMETIMAPAIYKDVLPGGIGNVTNLGHRLKTSIYHLINTSFNALPDLSGGMMVLKDLGKSVRTVYNKLISTCYNALPDFSGGIIILKDLDKSVRTGYNKQISTFHNVLAEFSGGMMVLKDLGKSVRTGYNNLISTCYNALTEFSGGIMVVKDRGKSVRTGYNKLISTCYKALPDFSGGMMVLKDLGESVRTGYNKLISTLHNALPDFSGGIIVLEDIGKSFKTGCNKLIRTYHNVLPDFSKWTNSIFELTTSSKLHQLAEKLETNFKHFVEFVLIKMQQVKAYAQDYYEELRVRLNDKKWEYELQQFEKCMFECFDSAKTLEMCIRGVRRAYRKIALKTHPDKAKSKGALFDELNNQQFIRTQESKDYLLRKCKERFAKS